MIASVDGDGRVDLVGDQSPCEKSQGGGQGRVEPGSPQLFVVWIVRPWVRG